MLLDPTRSRPSVFGPPSLVPLAVALVGGVYGVVVARYSAPQQLIQYPTNDAKDIAVFGKGFIALVDSQRQFAYVTCGTISRTVENPFCIAVKDRMWQIAANPSPSISTGNAEIHENFLQRLDPGAIVSVKETPLRVVRFRRPDQLEMEPRGVYRESRFSGPPADVIETDQEVGGIRMGWSEMMTPNTSTQWPAIVAVAVISIALLLPLRDASDLTQRPCN